MANGLPLFDGVSNDKQETKVMRPPFAYFGGKQLLSNEIIARIPEHSLYVEPFAGGLAVFFAKKPSPVEVINDTNKELINFYRCTKSKFDELQALIQETLHSRKEFDHAKIIYNNPDLFTDVKRAWAVHVLATQSFVAKLDSTFATSMKENDVSIKIHYRREGFVKEFANRLERVQIECADALYVINARDRDFTFFYCDPPYIDTNCGHYKGYTLYEYENLLKKLSGIKGKFLLSSFQTPILQQYVGEFGWKQVKLKGVSSASKGGVRTSKVEILTANYDIE